MGLKIDLNCDLGEGCGNDAALMDHISSANIACGGHAGDAETMRRTAGIAIEKGVAIGAHPGYADRENFGRRQMHLSATEVIELITDQIATLDTIVGSLGGRIAHVKPHGALYNHAARDPELAAAIAAAVAAYDPQLVLFGLSGSPSIEEGEKAGLTSASEVFADRTYRPDLSLTPRSEPNALITDPDHAVTQSLDMIKYGRVRTTDGTVAAIRADTICIHGDGPAAVEFAAAITDALAANDISIEALNV